MDEGVNSFTEYEMMTRRYRYVLEFPFGAGFTSLDFWARASVPASPELDPILAPSWGYSSGRAYGENSYSRPALVLEQIRRLVGEERFWRALKEYAERWRYDHPTSEDLFDAFRRASPSPYLEALISRTFRGTGSVDFKVLRATSRPAEELTGFDDALKATNFTEAEGAKPGKGPDPKKPRKDRTDAAKGPFDTVVVVGRDGEIVLPVEVVLTFADGKTHRTSWDGRSRWIRLKATYASKLAKVEVDPAQSVVLDRDTLNNARYLPAWRGPSAAAKVRAYGVHLFQILVTTLWALV